MISSVSSPYKHSCPPANGPAAIAMEGPALFRSVCNNARAFKETWRLVKVNSGSTSCVCLATSLMTAITCRFESTALAAPFAPVVRPNVCPFAVPAAAWLTTLCMSGSLSVRPRRNKALIPSLPDFHLPPITSCCPEMSVVMCLSLLSNSALRNKRRSAATTAGVCLRCSGSFF